MDPNGKNVERLTMFPYIKAPVSSPVWSPDGTFVAFLGDGASGKTIYLMHKDGMFNDESNSSVDNLINSEKVPLEFCREHSQSNGYSLHSLSWSHDGQQLVFTCPAKENTDELVCIVNLQKDISCWSIAAITDGKTKLPGGAKVDWSPIQARLALSFGLPGEVTDEIYLVDPDGQNAVFLAEGSNPCWSPDGRRLLFFQNNQRICVIDQDGSDLQCPYTAPEKLSEFVTLDERPLLFDSSATWSPNGRSIAFTASRATSMGGHTIHLLNLRTGESKRLTVLGDGIFSDPDWFP